MNIFLHRMHLGSRPSLLSWRLSVAGWRPSQPDQDIHRPALRRVATISDTGLPAAVQPVVPNKLSKETRDTFQHVRSQIISYSKREMGEAPCDFATFRTHLHSL